MSSAASWAVGALFGALNTMYSAVSVRSREIATLRAIGFGASAVVLSVLIEAMLLSVIGALIGAGLAWVFFQWQRRQHARQQFYAGRVSSSRWSVARRSRYRWALRDWTRRRAVPGDSAPRAFRLPRRCEPSKGLWSSEGPPCGGPLNYSAARLLLGRRVVLLVVDTAALTILRSLDATLLGGIDATIRRCVRLSAIDMRLAAFEGPGFPIGQLAAFHAVRNSLLLIHVALHIRLHALG